MYFIGFKYCKFSGIHHRIQITGCWGVFGLFLPSIGWPCAMVLELLVFRWLAAVLVRTGKVRGLVRTENAYLICKPQI